MRSQLVGRLPVRLMKTWVLGCAVTSLGGIAQIDSAEVRGSGQTGDPYAAAREELVEQAIVGAGIDNQRVIQAMRSTPRHEFVLPAHRAQAYLDMALPILGGQTISPPYVVAFMTAQLDPQPTDRVLEIGTGSGYQAAVLSPLVDEVYSIEIVAPLARRASTTLRRLGYENVTTKRDDGFLGWPEHAPFDKIIVTCSPENVPQPLVDQLTEGGRLVVPLGERFQQVLYLYRKRNGELQRESLESTFFVPMTGRAERERQQFPDLKNPRLQHGGFEQLLGESTAPAGWYYVRQAAVASESGVPEGSHCLRLENRTAGRPAHAMQAFGVNGREVQTLDLSMWVSGDQIEAGPTVAEQASCQIEFYGQNRAPVGRWRLGPWRGSFDWRLDRTRIAVPPTARLAVVGVGLFGATGVLRVDRVRVAPDGLSPP